MQSHTITQEKEAALVADLRKTLGDYLLFGNGAERRFTRVIDIMEQLDGREYREFHARRNN